MICYLLKRKSPLTNGIQPLIAKTDINFWTFLWTPIQAIKPGAHSLKFSCVLRILFIEKKRCGMIWQATDLMVQIRLDGVEAPCPLFFQPHGGTASSNVRKKDSWKNEVRKQRAELPRWIPCWDKLWRQTSPQRIPWDTLSPGEHRKFHSERFRPRWYVSEFQSVWEKLCK